MIYRNNKNSTIESNIESLFEVAEIAMGYKVNYFTKGTDVHAPRHGARFKFVLGSTELGCVPMIKDPITSERYVFIKKNLQWNRIVNSRQIAEMIDIAIALTEYLGDVYVDFYTYGTRKDELEFLANQFSKISKREFKHLVSIGRPKVRYEN